MTQIGVMGGLYNRDNVIANMEGYIYMISIIIMWGYIRGLKLRGRGKERGGEDRKASFVDEGEDREALNKHSLGYFARIEGLEEAEGREERAKKSLLRDSNARIEREVRREEGWEMEIEVMMLSVMGMVLLIWSYDLITTYLGIELQSLALYMITSRSEERRLVSEAGSGSEERRRSIRTLGAGAGYKHSMSVNSENKNNTEESNEVSGNYARRNTFPGRGAISGIKYYILGILSSSILLMGIVMMYQEMGTTHNEGIRMIQETEGGVGKIGGYMMIAGILFKLALPPFHNWAPDVYDGVETRKTVWIAVTGKIAYMVYIYKVRIYEMGMMEGVIVGALIVGSVMGLTQNRVKRLLAYSTINQMGYPLMGLLTTGVISRVSYIFYNVQYWVTLINSFCIMMALGGRYEIRYISSIYRESPVLLMALVINMYSLIGIPPLIGFFGKQMVLSGGLLGGYVGLVTVAIITSVISGAYYLRIIKEVVLKDRGKVKNKISEIKDITKDYQEFRQKEKDIKELGSEERRKSKKTLSALNKQSMFIGYYAREDEERLRDRRYGVGVVREMGPISWIISIITIVTMLYGLNPRLMVVPISLMVMET